VLFIVTTSGFEEIKLNAPPLSESGAVIEKLASPLVLTISDIEPQEGLAFSTITVNEMDAEL
jgi:hypothetical protein